MQEMNRAVFSRHDILTVGECAALTVEDAAAVSSPARAELNMAFLFEHTDYYNVRGEGSRRSSRRS